MQTLSPSLIDRIDAHARAAVPGVPAAPGIRRPAPAGPSPAMPAETATATRDAAPPEQALAWPEIKEISLCVVGFNKSERKLLDDLILVSLRRGPRLKLVPTTSAHVADVVMIDATHAPSVAWSRSQSWLSRRAVVWVNGEARQPWHAQLRKPVQWPVLPVVLARAMQRMPRAGQEVSARPQQPDAPMIMVLGEDSETRHRVRRQLETSGFRVTCISRAREGLAALHAASYACVVQAGALPDATPLDTRKRLRDMEDRVGRLPFVMLDDAPDAWARWRARWVGCDVVAPEPQGRRAWRALLQPLLDARSAVPVAAAASA